MAMNYNERELRRLGDGDLADIVANVHAAFLKRHPDLNDIALLSQLAANEAPAKLTPADQDRQLRDAMRPFVQEYSAAKVHTPNLINHTWQGLWKVIGKAIGFKYKVPLCDRTTEELARLQKESRAVLLLPGNIYTPDGLVRLGGAFPLMRSWTTDPKEVVKISHSSTEGGSIDIEMSLDAPYRTSEGYRQQELVDRITVDGRSGQRFPTYLVGSEFSQLLTGQYFDINTWSRLPGSSYEGNLLDAASFFHSGGRAVILSRWGPQLQFPFLGGRSEGVKRA